MVRNLKVLGLGLAAVFALSAMTASAASAQNGPGTLTSTGPVTLTGALTGTTFENSLTTFENRRVSCGPNTKYTGHKVLTQKQTEEGKKHELLPNDSSSVTVTPHFTECITEVSGLKFPTTVDMNGCDFEFDLGVTISANKYKIKTTEECPTNNTIKLTVFENATKHAQNSPFCVKDITKKTDRGEGLTATDTLNGSFDITGTVENIVVHEESPTGSILCTKKEDPKAILHVDINVTGDNVGGTATTVSLSHV